MCRLPRKCRAWPVCRWLRCPRRRNRDRAKCRLARWDRSRVQRLLYPRQNLLPAIRCRGRCLCRCSTRRRCHRVPCLTCRWATWRESQRRWNSVLRLLFPAGWRERRRCRQRFLRRYSAEPRKSQDRADRPRQRPCCLARCQRGPYRRPGPAEAVRRRRSRAERWRIDRSGCHRFLESHDRRCWPAAERPAVRG